MINKKNVLGKIPEELGVKDAIHTAIVSVRAAKPINPGQICRLNENREAVPSAKGVGVADPFLKNTIRRGQSFWLILGQAEVPNVQHVWEHPIDFSPPTTPAKLNVCLKEISDLFGVTYEQLLEAGQYVVDHNQPMKYPGTKTEEELDEARGNFDQWEFWSEWASETLYEFTNTGSECCPEYEYPECDLFKTV